MKSNRLITLILSGAMAMPMVALAQTANSGTASGESANASTAQQNERGERRERGENDLRQKSQIFSGGGQDSNGHWRAPCLGPGFESEAPLRGTER